MKRLFAPVSQDFIQRDQFRHEQVYCESPHNPEDVLCYGSDDDAYDAPIERKLRIEHQANRFLHGLPMFIASASLHGPFERESGWENPWRSHNSVTRTPGRPHKRLKTSAVSIPKHRPEPERPVPPTSSLNFQSSDLPQDRPSSPVHEYMDNTSFSRVKSWRDGVVSVAQVDSVEEDTPRPRSSSTRTSRVSHRTPRDPVSSQVIGDSFDTSRIVQPSSTQAGVWKSAVRGSSTTPNPHPSIRKTEPPPSQRADSSLRNYTSLATTPTRQSPEKVEPHSIPELANKKPEQPIETTVNDASSSDLSDLSQPTPAVPRYEAPPESVSSSSESSVEPAKEVAVAPSKRLSAVRLQDYSDRSFRFRGVAPRRDLAPETISTETSTRTPVQPRETENKEEDVEVMETENAPTLDRMMPHSPYYEETIVPQDSSPDELPEHSIVVKNEVESLEAEVSHHEHVEADATHVACPDVDGDASMIDGPTLIPSTVSSDDSDSDLSDVASIGNFSCEKQSQALLQEMVSLPRKLLWPKSKKGTADSSLSSDPGMGEAEMTKRGHSTEEESAGTSDAVVQRSNSPSIKQEIVVEEATTDEGSTDDCSDQTDEEEEEEEEANIDGGCTTLGTPLPERHQEQSPWRNSQIEVKVQEEIVAEPIETEEHPDAAGHVSPPSAKASLETKSQSPWAKEPTQPPQSLEVPEQPEVSPENKEGGPELPFTSGQVLNQASQSPWAKGDSQIVAATTVPDSRLFNPLSSPAKSTNSPLKEISLPNLSVLPLRDQGEMSNSQEACPPLPSTPELKESSLPSPEYTHPIKSFREFLTPSPQKPRPSKRRRISAVNDGKFPSTQVLVDAAVSNPWLEPSQRRSSKKRKQLQVSWAPLPGEEGEEDTSIVVADESSVYSLAGAEFPDEPKVSSSVRMRPKSILRIPRRASSPPPQSLPRDLPAEQEKFGKHFAAVASRGAARRNKLNTTSLQSSSQLNSDSPQIEAMANRFLAADDISKRSRAISVLSDGEQFERVVQSAKACLISNHSSSSQLSTPVKEPVVSCDNDDGDSVVELSPGDVVFEISDNDEEEEEEEPESVDPVKDVMQNLDSFFEDTWEFGGEKDKGPSPEVLVMGGDLPRSSGSNNSHRRSAGGSGGFRSSGLIDSTTNVWEDGLI